MSPKFDAGNWRVSLLRAKVNPLFLAGVSWFTLVASFFFPVLMGSSKIPPVTGLLLASLISLGGMWLASENPLKRKNGKISAAIGFVASSLGFISALFFAIIIMFHLG